MVLCRFPLFYKAFQVFWGRHPQIHHLSSSGLFDLPKHYVIKGKWPKTGITGEKNVKKADGTTAKTHVGTINLIVFGDR